MSYNRITTMYDFTTDRAVLTICLRYIHNKVSYCRSHIILMPAGKHATRFPPGHILARHVCDLVMIMLTYCPLTTTVR
jgi:hypothetical protein